MQCNNIDEGNWQPQTPTKHKTQKHDTTSLIHPQADKNNGRLQNNVKQKDGTAIQIANTTPNDRETKFTPRRTFVN